MTGVLIEREEGNVRMEAETGIVSLQAQERPGC